ncbi:hypothetical protein [Photorhabdus sp. RM71S]|uniref:hypothetical protein n=1 Tax=Photorhabdus sp. RM71S TaxID=3342824 RepID=UPI0036DE9DA4
MKPMKQTVTIGVLLCAILFVPAMHAASCAATSAAMAGAQAGYKQDRKAAESWTQREQQASNGFSQCLGDISTSITVPTFPDFSHILDQIKSKVCAAARDKVSSLLPSNIDPWGDLGQGYIPTTNIPVSIRSARNAVNTVTSSAPAASSAPSAGNAYPFSL